MRMSNQMREIIFQLTRLVRGVTGINIFRQDELDISTHTPRERRD